MPAPKGNKFALGNRGGTGRPTKYRGVWHCKKIHQLFHLPQMTLKKCAEIFDISESTLMMWLDQYEEFFDAYKSAKEELDARVTVSLRESATGFVKRTEKTVFDKDSPCPDCDGLGKVGPRGKKTKCESCQGTGRGRVVRIPTRTYFAPDVAAIKFWLMNRQGWKSTKAVEWDGTINVGEDGDSIDVNMLSAETRALILRDIENAAREASEAGGEVSKASKASKDSATREASENDTKPKPKPKPESNRRRNRNRNQQRNVDVCE